jgi:hypothetical protein
MQSVAYFTMEHSAQLLCCKVLAKLQESLHHADQRGTLSDLKRGLCFCIQFEEIVPCTLELWFATLPSKCHGAPSA